MGSYRAHRKSLDRDSVHLNAGEQQLVDKASQATRAVLGKSQSSRPALSQEGITSTTCYSTAAGDLHIPVVLAESAAGKAKILGKEDTVPPTVLQESRQAVVSQQELPGSPGSRGAGAPPPPGSSVTTKQAGPPQLNPHQGADDEWEFEWEDGGQHWYRRRTSRWTIIMVGIVALFTALGVGFILLEHYVTITVNGEQLQLWRIFFFIAGLPIIWWCGSLIELAVVYVVEKTMFTWRNAIYFAYAIKKPARNVVRAALVLGWWAGIMTAGNGSMVSGLTFAYIVILRIWACITLFMTANLLKTLLAKVLSLKFNQKSHLQRMHDALRKEYFLHLLLQPRAKPIPKTEALAGEGEQEDKLSGETFGGGASREHHQDPVSGVDMEGASLKAQEDAASPSGASVGKAHLSPHARLLERIGEDSVRELPPPSADLTPRPSINITIHQHGSPLKRPSLVSRGSHSSVTSRHGQDLGSRAFPRSSPSGASRASRQWGPDGRRASRLLSGGLPRSMTGARESKEAKQELRKMEALAAVQVESPSVAAGSGSSKVGIDPKMADQLIKMEKYIRKNALQVRFNDQLVQTERCEDVNSELEAKKLGFYLFWHLKADARSEVVEKEDLQGFLSANDVQPAFEWLDDNGDGIVNLRDCCSAVAKVFTERKNLAASLKDTKSVVGKVELLLGGIIHIFFAFLYMAVFQVDVIHVYLALTSLVVALSFIFGSSLSEMYENVVFLFIVHPFDIGDLLVLGDYFYKVDEINIQFTTLINTSTNARNWWPNQLLMSEPFVNMSASGVKALMIKLLVDLDTPGSVLDEVRAAMQRHVKENPSEFTPEVSANFYDSANPMKMTLMLYWELSHNGTDTGRASRARSTMFICIAETLTRLGVSYCWPPTAQKKQPRGVPEGVVQEQTDGGAVVNSGALPLAGDVLNQKFL